MIYTEHIRRVQFNYSLGHAPLTVVSVATMPPRNDLSLQPQDTGSAFYCEIEALSECPSDVPAHGEQYW
jgi:hypothetical protein